MFVWFLLWSSSVFPVDRPEHSCMDVPEVAGPGDLFQVGGSASFRVLWCGNYLIC